MNYIDSADFTTITKVLIVGEDISSSTIDKLKTKLCTKNMVYLSTSLNRQL
jgi:hypothetical protein